MSSHCSRLFSHPREYRIAGIAGGGAYAIVCKAEVLDENFAKQIGLLEESLSRQATTLSGQYSSDVVADASPQHVSPLQELQRQASAQLLTAAADGEGGCRPGTVDTSLATGSAASAIEQGRSGSTLGTLGLPSKDASPGGDDVRDVSSSAPATAVTVTANGITTTMDGSPAAPSFGDVAIKQILDHSSVNRAVSDRFRTHYLRKVCREIEIIRHFKGVPQVIDQNDLYLGPSGNDVYIVMPYVHHNLRQILNKISLEEAHVRWLMCQLLLGLNAIHKAGVIHRDLTLANVMVNDATWDVLIADFGLSRARETEDQEISLDVVTLPYRAPELLLEYTRYTSRIDIWAFGCIMAETLTRTPFLYIDPNKNPDSFKQLKVVLKVFGFPDLDEVAAMASERNTNFLRRWASELGEARLPRGQDVGDVLRQRREGLQVSEQALEVLRDALQFDPAKRLSAAQLLEKPWFQEDPDCKHLIDVCSDLPDPGPCPTAVEGMGFAELQRFLVDATSNRRATVDSYVSELAESGLPL